MPTGRLRADSSRASFASAFHHFAPWTLPCGAPKGGKWERELVHILCCSCLHPYVSPY